MQKIYFYITTPLYAASAKPLLGHACAALAADIMARHKRARQIPVFFQTGTDEHGAEIENKAGENGMPPQSWCDSGAGELRTLWKLLNISPDHFIRTTGGTHEAAAQAAFEKLIASGDIYPGKPGGRQDRSREEPYFFRLSKYEKNLLAHYAANPLFLAPGRAARETAGLTGSGLEDLPVSRTATAWGIKVPSNPAHAIAPWFGALMGYATGPGYDPGKASDSFQMKWPADIQLAGRDALRLHAVVWPALLMALGLKPPKMIFVHGDWTVDGKKISGTEAAADLLPDLVREYGADALRYFLFREVPFGADGIFSRAALIRRYDADLAGGLGDLFSKVLGMVQKYLGDRLPDKPENAELFEELSSLGPEINAKIDAMRFSEALDGIWRAVGSLNKKIDRKKPWELAEMEPVELKLFLHDLVWCLRVIAGWIYPFMPDTATRMQLGLAVGRTAAGGFDIQKPHPLFPRK
ncbi:MAG: class I tRNA ligase family protein [Elusimicrobiales bacterium]|jgi:methionyl-tRNA synthetase